jgi:creatinine amidohydrolase
LKTPSPYVQAYRSRYLASLSLAEIAALSDKAWAPVILVTGAIEQHGPHLPVAVDAFIGEALVTLALERLPPDASCYIAPPITIGKSNEHSGFPGTLSVSRRTLRALVLCVARQVADWGFRSLYILNTHGGNMAVNAYTLREAEARFGLKAEPLRTDPPAGAGVPVLPPQEQNYGFHANTAETAWMLALLERHVRAELAVRDYVGGVDDPGELRPERTVATYSWVSQDLSKTGIMGDAPAGTKEMGERWLPAVGQAYADAIARVCREARAAAKAQ